MSSLRTRPLAAAACIAAFSLAGALFAQSSPPPTPPAPPAGSGGTPTGTGATKPAGTDGAKPSGTDTGKPAATDGPRKPVPMTRNNMQARPRQGDTKAGDPALSTSQQGPIPINVAKGAAPAQDDSLDQTPIIRFEPEEMNFGEMQVDVPQTGKIKIVNISDKPITIARAIPSCGCTTPIWPKDPIPAGGSADMEITLKPGGRAGVPLSKTVTLQVDGHAPIRLNVKGTIPEYVKIVPEMVEAPGSAGRPASDTVTFTSVDGTPFKVTGMTPAIGMTEDMTDAAQNAKSEHKIRIDWEKWAQAGRVFRAQFSSDHPKASTLNVMIRRPVERPVANDPSGKKPADPVHATPSGLVMAANRGDAAEVKRLIAAGQDVNQADPSTMRTALHWAAKNSQMEILEALLAAGASIKATDRTGRIPLALAAEGGSVPAIQRLLKDGSDINARDQLGGTPILWAAGLGSPEAVQALLDAGADATIADGNGMTPLIWAANLGDSRNVDVLLKSGKVNIEAADLLTGDTALMRACRNGKKESITLLVDKGAKVDVRNRQGMTPFLLACQSGSLDKVKAVVAGKPDLKAMDARGWGAVDHARARADAERAAILEYLTGELKLQENSAAKVGTGDKASAASATKGASPAPAPAPTGANSKGS